MTERLIDKKSGNPMRRIAAENEQEQACNDVDDKTHAKKRNA